MTSNLDRSARQLFWEKHLAQWHATELGQAEYCRLNKISLKSFQYWNRKSKRKGALPALVEVPLGKPLSVLPVLPQLCLVIGQHYRIEIGKGFDSEDLERVVRMLERP